jgi:archaellum biogenesis ATPase FlaH
MAAISANAILEELPAGQFSQYNKPFQEKIFQGLLTDQSWASQMVEVMRPDFFDLRYLEYLCEKYFSYFKQYKCFPTQSLLISIIKDSLNEEGDLILRDQIVSFLIRMRENPNPGDIFYVKEKTLDFCKRQAFKEALEKSVELISTDNFESVISLMKNAISIGMPNTVGHDFFEDLEARFQKIDRCACPTGIPELDSKDILAGGLGRGEIGVVTANTGVGKSHFLVQMGANAMRNGKNVLHYTLELTEQAVGIRYDSNLCDIPASDIIDNKHQVIDFYKNNTELGRLMIKEYPTGTATVTTIRNHVEKLSLRNFKPSVILIDYADIMRSTRQFDSLRHELKLIYEELRNLAMELRIPIWTASQANRDSANSDIVGLENMSEAYGKAMVADFVVSLSRKPSEKAVGTGRLFIAKNRAGKDGILFPIHIDTSRSQVKVFDTESITLAQAHQDDKEEAKELIRRKWKEINNI